MEQNKNEVLVKASFVCKFETFHSWVNHASSWLGHIDLNENTLICLDVNGNECNIGQQFQYARDNNLFPVTAWVLIKNDE